MYGRMLLRERGESVTQMNRGDAPEPPKRDEPGREGARAHLRVWKRGVLDGPVDQGRSDGVRVTGVGTVAYRGLGGERGLALVRDDCERGVFAPAALSGAYCVVLEWNDRIDIITDAGNTYAIFGDRKDGIVSSSLHMALVASGRKRALNRDALCEQLITGAVTGEDTCFEGIERLNGCGTIRAGNVPITCQQAPLPISDVSEECGGFDGCVKHQLTVLCKHFETIRSLAGTRGVSMGLSGGYDSRLMLLLALQAGISVQAVYLCQSWACRRKSHRRQNSPVGPDSSLRRVEVRPLEIWAEPSSRRTSRMPSSTTTVGPTPRWAPSGRPHPSEPAGLCGRRRAQPEWARSNCIATASGCLPIASPLTIG